MMRNLYAKWIAGLFCLGAAVLPAAEPVASLLYKSNLDVKNPSDMAAPAVKSKQNPLENFDTKEFSGGFWIRFDFYHLNYGCNNKYKYDNFHKFHFKWN